MRLPHHALLFMVLIGSLSHCLCLPAALAVPQTQKARDAELLAAVKKQDAVRVSALLAARANPNAQDEDNWSVLAHAAENGSLAICEALLKKGAKVDGEAEALVTPLLLAISNKHAPVARLLIEHGAKVDSTTGLLSRSALSVAAETGQTEILKMLLDRGANIELNPKNGSFPLGVAAANGQKAAVELLLSRGAPLDAVDEEGQSALMLAAAGSQLEVVEILLAHKARVDLSDNMGDTALELAKGAQKDKIIAALRRAGAKEAAPDLFRAVKKNDTPLLRALLEKGADPNAKDATGRTPLFYSLAELDLAALKTLIEKGADPNVRDNKGITPLALAKEDHQGAVDELLAAGAYLPEVALSEAVAENDIKTVSALLDAKADPNGTGLQGELPLGTACAAGYSDLVRLLVSRGANVNAVQKNGMTPLITAVSAGDPANVRYLLEKGADAKMTTEDGMTPLIFVSGPASLEIARLLVEHGASTRARIKPFNRTALDALADTADGATLKYLLDHGAQEDINVKDEENSTPLASAALGMNLEAVRLLLERGANPNTADTLGDTPLHEAVAGMGKAQQERLNHPPKENSPLASLYKSAEKRRLDLADGMDVIRLLVKHGAKLEVKDRAGQTPMEKAMRMRCWDAIIALRQLGARSPAPRGPKDLAAAVEEEDIAAVKRLLARGANPNVADSSGFTPLMTAALRGDMAIMQELLNHGAKPDFRVPQGGGYLPTTPLILAAEQGHLDIVRLLLKRGANPNAKMDANNSPLIKVLTQGQWEAIRILVEAGIDVNAGEKTGFAPLSRAVVMLGGTDTVRLLIAKGAHVNAKFPAGMTLLMDAARFGRADNIPILLKAGADIHAQSDNGDTVLMSAVQSGDVETVRVVLNELLRTKSDINIRNKQSKTALSFALDKHIEEIVELLKDGGAKE